MSPLFPPPAGYRLDELLHAAPDAQLWRAARDSRTWALRLALYQGPVDPVPFLERMGEIARGLELSHLNVASACGGTEGGFWLAEAWVEGPPFTESAGPRRLAPLVTELERLHQARKWHGGLTAARLRLTEQGYMAVQFPWSAWLSTLSRSRAQRLEESGPEAPELAQGPRWAGPGLDTFALGKLLTPHLRTPAGQAWVQAATSADPTARPRLSALLPLL